MIIHQHTPVDLFTSDIMSPVDSSYIAALETGLLKESTPGHVPLDLADLDEPDSGQTGNGG